MVNCSRRQMRSPIRLMLVQYIADLVASLDAEWSEFAALPLKEEKVMVALMVDDAAAEWALTYRSERLARKVCRHIRVASSK